MPKPTDEQMYMLNKLMFYQMMETQQIEEEIMELYHQKKFVNKHKIYTCFLIVIQNI